MDRFLTREQNRWRRLEELLDNLKGRSLRGLSRMEVREFGELYRRAAADLAIARAETRDPKLINYLNSLVIRAHGKLYRAENEGTSLIADFFARDLPRTFRRNWTYMAISGGVFFLFVVFGFIATYIDTDFTNFVMLSGVVDNIRNNEYWWRSLNDANQIGASFILSNNIIVSIRAFAMGALLCVGAIYDIAFFGAHVGSIFGAAARINPPFAGELGAFIVGHGVLEISTVLFCGGAGMMIGYAIIAPGDRTRTQALKEKGVEAARIVVGCACFLVVAGLIEGFLSPAEIPSVFKYATGVGTGLALYSYLVLAGRDEPAAETAGPSRSHIA
ncbi:MAG: stage II sporulation protein M [Pyrinomonadaceae bacterium]